MSLPIIELVQVPEEEQYSALDAMNAALMDLYAGNATLVPAGAGILALTSDAPRNPEIDERVIRNCMEAMRGVYPKVKRLHCCAPLDYTGDPDYYMDRIAR